MNHCDGLDVFAVPGFRRTIRIEPERFGPSSGYVRSSVEDDLHAMMVELWHEQGTITRVEAIMHRMPWSTCPGAQQVLQDTFTDIALADVTARLARQDNCTHLHDLALFAAAHALRDDGMGDDGMCEYTIAISDPIAGTRVLEVRLNGVMMHRWIEQDGVFTMPEAIAGRQLFTLRDWISNHEGPALEAARILQWAGLMGHSRTLSDKAKHDALFHRVSCYTMEPERAKKAQKASPELDFSSSGRTILAGGRERFEAARKRLQNGPGNTPPA